MRNFLIGLLAGLAIIGWTLAAMAQRPPCDAQASQMLKRDSALDRVLKLARDPRSHWYDRASLPGVYFDHSQLFPVGYNIAAYDPQTGQKIDKTGSANNDAQWLHTGGLSDCDPGRVTVKRMIWLPRGEWIELFWMETSSDARRNVPVRWVGGEYPAGFVSAEFMFDGIRLFEVRARIKRGPDDWHTQQHEIGPKPLGYKPVDNCVECHEDIGKHSFAIDPKRDWYGVVRGLERGRPIHWHPFQGASNAGDKPRIRDAVKRFVRWRSTGEKKPN